MKKLSNTEAELKKKALLIKKSVYVDITGKSGCRMIPAEKLGE